jgi:hypothetical protein
MKDFIQVILIIACVIMLLPAALILGVWVAFYGVLIIPVTILGILIWRAVKRRIKERNEPIQIPIDALDYIPAPRPQKMIKWQGKEVPLKVFILSLILSVILVPIILFCLIFVFNPFVSACIIGFFACRKASEVIQRKA